MHSRPCVIIAWLQISSESTATLKRTGGCFFFFSSPVARAASSPAAGHVEGRDYSGEETVADRMLSVLLLGLEISAILCSPCNQRREICSCSPVKTPRIVGVKSERSRR